MIKTVIFDIDGVVATFDFPSICQEFERLTDISATELTTVFDRNKEELLLGHMSAEQFFSQLSQKHSQAISGLVQAWRQAGIKHVSLNQDIIKLIRVLRGQYSIGVLSNASSLRKIIDTAMEDFYTEFDFTLFSCNEGMKKPDPDFFRLALKQASASPEQAIFVDNREKYITAAVALGIRGVVYSDTQSLERDLRVILES